MEIVNMVRKNYIKYRRVEPMKGRRAAKVRKSMEYGEKSLLKSLDLSGQKFILLDPKSESKCGNWDCTYWGTDDCSNWNFPNCEECSFNECKSCRSSKNGTC